jgi:hypothetical protein
VDKKDSLGFLDSIKDLKVSDVEFIENHEEALLKINFTNEESIVIAGSDMDIYLLTPKDVMVH